MRRRRTFIPIALGTAIAFGGTFAAVGGPSQASATVLAGKYPSIPAGAIKFGWVGPLSGPLATIGLQTEAADKAMVALVNKQGGIAGHKIDMLVANDQDDPATGISQTEKLISQGVVAFLNAGFGAVLDPVIAVLDKSHVPAIVPEGQTEYGNGSAHPYFFTDLSLNSEDAATIAKYLASKHLTKAGVISDGSPYGNDLVSQFKTAAKANKVDIVGTQTYTSTAVSVTTQLKALQDAGAQVLVLLAESGDQEVFSGIAQTGWSAPIVGDIITFDYASAVGSLASRTFATCPPGLATGETPSAGLATAMKAYLSSSSSAVATPAAPFNLAAVDLFKAAIERVHSTSGSAIRTGLQEIHNQSFMDPTYRFTFTAKSHGGWVGADSVCQVTPLGPDNLPVRAG